MKKTIVTRTLLISRIQALLDKKITTSEFGDEMILYLVLDDQYVFEENHEKLIDQVLCEFMDMHDADKGNVGYEPYIPPQQRMLEIIDQLKK